MGLRRREQRQQRWVFAFAALIVLVVLIIPGYGYYTTFVAPPRQVVFSVNGVEHTLGEVAKFSKANVAAVLGQGGQPDISTLPIDIALNLLNEELVSQAAPLIGLAVTPEEVDAEIRNRHFPTPKAGEQTDSVALEREYQERYSRYLDFTKFSEDEYKEIVRRSVLREKLVSHLAAQVPEQEEHVYVHWIHVREDSLIEEIAEKISQGEDFDRLARIYNIGDVYSDDNGDVGWVPRGAFPIMDPTIFSLEPGNVSDALQVIPDIYFIKVTDGPEIRDISDKMKTLLKSRVLDEWIEIERDKNDVDLQFGSAEYEWVVEQIRAVMPPGVNP